MIHPTASIHPGARLGSDVRVGPFSLLDDGVCIGDRCEIGPHVVVYRNTSIGPESQVHAGAVLGDLPQDKRFRQAESFVEIGTRCRIREGVTVHRGTTEGSVTRVGNGCFLMANSHVAHNVEIGDQVVLANGALLAGYVQVGEGAFISGNCAVHQFVRIGRLAMMAGCSGASRDVPPFSIIRPVSWNVLMGLNIVGLRRAEVPKEDCNQLRQAFHLLFEAGLKQKAALERVRETLSSELVQELCRFIETSERGVCGFESH